jgi:hypothetical protein
MLAVVLAVVLIIAAGAVVLALAAALFVLVSGACTSLDRITGRRA